MLTRLTRLVVRTLFKLHFRKLMRAYSYVELYEDGTYMPEEIIGQELENVFDGFRVILDNVMQEEEYLAVKRLK